MADSCSPAPAKQQAWRWTDIQHLEGVEYKGEVVLGDEFSPDGSRLWDKETLEKMDKDRFRQSLGGLIEAYEAVARRLGVQLD